MFKASQLLIGNQIKTSHEREDMTENVVFEGTTEDLAERLALDPAVFEVLREHMTLGDLVGLESHEQLEPQLL